MFIKTKIQNYLHEKCVKQYNALLEQEKYLRSHAYEAEEPVAMPETCKVMGDFTVIPLEECGANFNLQEIDSPFLLIAKKDGYLSQKALDVIRRKMKTRQSLNVCYAHEDRIDTESGVRSDPWFKPVWSPDTFLSYNYFGSMVAVRTGTAKKTKWGGFESPEKNVYDLLLQILFPGSIEMAALIDEVLYHTKEDSSANGQDQNESSSLQNRTAQNETAQNETAQNRTAQNRTAQNRTAQNETTQNGTTQNGIIIEQTKRGYCESDLIGEQLGVNRRLFGSEKDCADIRRKAYERIGVVSVEKTDAFGVTHIYPKPTGEKVSILIPSKDHPEVLHRCVASLRTHSTYPDYEIIVVDNGSSPEKKAEYEKIAAEYECAYFYEPMDFNFSIMCNLAASKASGDYYLFLNDDMEIFQPDWLEILQGYASMAHSGAVGAKLYYPGGQLLQHTGITNLTEGPVHKVQGEDDATSYYYGVNRVNRDAIGVTAACLMLQKQKFEEIGRFYEGLAVAYNDVDLNFQLHQNGYYNIQVNAVTIYHHESLSRGNDMMDESKKKRLWAENKVLYDRNPSYYDFDPFYGRHLTGVSNNYYACHPSENRNLEPIAELKKCKGSLPVEKRNETLIISTDHVEKNRRIYDNGCRTYLIDLHAHVRGLDSADYDYTLFLRGQNGTYELPAVRRFRPDVGNNLYNEAHVEMSGFAVRIFENVLPGGEYEIWVKAKCKCSRQVLYNKAEEKLVVDQQQNMA